MLLPKTILVPTDLSPNAERALDLATELAAKLDAKIVLLNAIGGEIFGVDAGVPVAQSVVDSIIDGNQRELDRLVAARAKAASFVPTRLEIGDARTVILNTASAVHADLIVMGTHGRRGFRRMLIGSVAESVARVAPCPVLLVPMKGDAS
ncbi:MAG TPA: universal stress protein [Kofleriaceae bacterium]|jgi:nucleotide-binding universal stress UspA family protein